MVIYLIFFYFSSNCGFVIGNEPLKYYYFHFLESFHFCSYKFYNSLQHIIFQKTLSFFSRMLIVLSSCQITNWLKKRLKMDSKLKFLSNCFELKSWKKKEMRCLNTLGIKCIMTKLYIYRKRIFVRMHLINGEMIFTDRYFFSHGTANSCGVMIGFHGNKKKKKK